MSELILPQIVLPGDEEERRRLRQEVLYNAILAHGDVSMLFHEPAQTEEILKTAEQFYNWVCQEPEHVSRMRYEARQAFLNETEADREFRRSIVLDEQQVFNDEAQEFKMTLDHWPMPENLDPDTPST